MFFLFAFLEVGHGEVRGRNFAAQSARVAFLYVTAEARERGGVGSAMTTELLRFCFDELGEQQVQKVELAVFPQNARAVRVYQKCGMTIRETQNFSFLGSIQAELLMMEISREAFNASRLVAKGSE